MSVDLSRLRIVDRSDGVGLSVKVVPGASRSRIVGLWNTALRVAVTAAPEGGRANDAVIALLAEVLDIAPSRIRIERGRTRALKDVRIASRTAEQIRRQLLRAFREEPEG